MKLYCLECGKELVGKSRKYCSRLCRDRYYYKQNKEHLNFIRAEWYRKNRAIGPRPKKSETAKKAYRKRYYYEQLANEDSHNKVKAYARKNSKTYYEKHKNDEHFKEVHRQNMRRYLERKKLKKTSN